MPLIRDLTAAVAAMVTVSAVIARPEIVVTLDMPHGECRLSVLTDGSAQLSYAAMPMSVAVAAGTFEPHSVLTSLEAVSRPDSERQQLTQPVGSVRLSRREQQLWFDDLALARGLFAKALANRLPTPASSLPALGAAVERSCAL